MPLPRRRSYYISLFMSASDPSTKITTNVPRPGVTGKAGISPERGYSGGCRVGRNAVVLHDPAQRPAREAVAVFVFLIFPLKSVQTRGPSWMD